MDGTRDWGHMPSMINLSGYLHLCKPAEALVSAVAWPATCYPETRSLLTTTIQTCSKLEPKLKVPVIKKVQLYRSTQSVKSEL